MKYSLFFEAPHRHTILVQLAVPPSGTIPTELRLSKWRPGRYELGPYIENILAPTAKTASGKLLEVVKTAYNEWQVAASGEEAAVVTYGYYACAPDAGASHFDTRQVYINGVNLFLYDPQRIDEPYTVDLHIPDDYRIATGLRREGKALHAKDFHELVDCPLIASPTLQHRAFAVEGITHNLWFQGEARPDFDRLVTDFTRFGAAQTRLFGGFPAAEYHYLFQIHNKHFYHGVEHQNSTVLAFGPGFRMMQPELYQELLGLCCHELFHTWNVKAIRPADMQPYDYDRQNYSRLHYVTEGVTTYYGDLMLMKSGVWSLEEFLDVVNESVLKKHYANNGRDHVSLEAASFDSWINGYKNTVPNRKISFYTKGCLAAFVLDYLIRRGSHNARSLDTVMREMYERFGKTGVGYTRADYKAIAEAHAGFPLDNYFEDYVSGVVPMEPALKEAAAYFGLEFVPKTIPNVERRLGFQLNETNPAIVKQVWENSPADRGGLAVDDEILALNGIRVTAGNFESLVQHFDGQDLELHVFRLERLERIALRFDPGYQLERYMFQPMAEPTAEQMHNRWHWMQTP